MKNIITLVGLLFVTQASIAQEYNDLKILFADGNYEKLVREAEKYTENDKTKYDADPYFWAAKALYKISLSGTLDEDYKNAYKDGITFLSKGMKYDIKKNDGAAMIEFNQIIEDYRLSLFTRISNEIGAESYKKAYAWAVKYKKISDESCGINFVIGACKYNDGDRSTARTAWVEAEKLIGELSGVDSWSEGDRRMLKLGVLETAKTHKANQQKDKAKEILNKAAQWFEEDDDWKAQYDEIVNG